MLGVVLLRVDEARAKGADMTQWGTAMACDWQSRQGTRPMQHACIPAASVRESY